MGGQRWEQQSQLGVRDADSSDCWPWGKEMDLGGVLEVKQTRLADGLHVTGEEKRGTEDK